MNRKNILIIMGFLALISLLAITSISLQNLQNDFRLFNSYVGYIFHILSVKNFQDNQGQGQFDVAELVVGNEEGFCESVEGFWAEDTRECLNITERYCRMITGSMTIDEETGKLGNCVLK